MIACVLADHSSNPSQPNNALVLRIEIASQKGSQGQSAHFSESKSDGSGKAMDTNRGVWSLRDVA
jgi:hypothetical protein